MTPRLIPNAGSSPARSHSVSHSSPSPCPPLPAGASRVHWLTHETNDTARLLYDRIADRSGFIQYRKLL